MKKYIIMFIFIAVPLWYWIATLNFQPHVSISSVSNALSSGKTDGFSRADKPRKFLFPKDGAAHSGFQTEWWYYTGNVQTAAGRKFGYQFTIFRRAIAPDSPQRKSGWATNQIYFAHFAISDIQQQRFLHREKFSRGALGLAGAEENPLRIWIENWSITHNVSNVEIKAITDVYAIDFKVIAKKPRVLNGKGGLSQKSSAKGNASYYYSQTRLETQGTITIDNQKFVINGLSWLDREWSTSVLGDNQVGWDWFSLQLDDEREIMLYQLRQKTQSIDPNSSGTFVMKDGSYEHLKNTDFSIEVLDYWTSKKSKIRYPSLWKIKIPKYQLEFIVKPHQVDQELRLNFAYWEGAVSINGSVQGNGYVEMTGYQEQNKAYRKD